MMFEVEEEIRECGLHLRRMLLWTFELRCNTQTGSATRVTLWRKWFEKFPYKGKPHVESKTIFRRQMGYILKIQKQVNGIEGMKSSWICGMGTDKNYFIRILRKQLSHTISLFIHTQNNIIFGTAKIWCIVSKYIFFSNFPYHSIKCMAWIHY